MASKQTIAILQHYSYRCNLSSTFGLSRTLPAAPRRADISGKFAACGVNSFVRGEIAFKNCFYLQQTRSNADSPFYPAGLNHKLTVDKNRGKMYGFLRKNEVATPTGV